MLGSRSFGAAGPGIAVLVKCIEEIGDESAMGVMGKLHRIRPAARGARGTNGLPASVLVVDLERGPLELRRRPGEDELDLLRRSGEACRTRNEAAGHAG